jgi:hypothetical protein
MADIHVNSDIIERKTGGKTDRQREIDVQVERWTYREMDRHTDIEMGRQQERWTDKNKGRERRDTREMDRQTEIQMKR